jgi:hypothetical protein
MNRIRNIFSPLIVYSPSFWFLLFLTVGLLGYLLPAVDYFSSIPGNLGDARFNSVILEHLYRWVTGTDTSLWSPPFFFPFKDVLAFSDNHLGSAPVYILLRHLGLDRELAFDGWFFIGNCLNFVVAYIVMRRFGFSDLGSAAGAFVFAFALPALSQEGHAQLVYRFAIPFAFVAFHNLLSIRRLANSWQVFFWVTVQFYCSIYLGIFLVYLLLATLLAFVLLNKGHRLYGDLYTSINNESPVTLLLSCLVALLCVSALLWLLYHYYAVSANYDFARPRGEIKEMLPRLSSYLIADHATLSAWIGNAVSVPMRHEHQMFFGIGVWLLCILGLISAMQGKLHVEVWKLSGLSLLILFCVTLSFGGFSLYMPLAYLPGINAIRAVTRVVLVMLLPVGFLVAIGSDNLLRNWAHATSMKIATGVLVLILVCLETTTYQSGNTPIKNWRERQDALRKLLPVPLPPRSVIFVSTKDSEPFYQAELDGMILAQDRGVQTLNGYSGNVPPGYSYPSPCTPFINRLYGYTSYRNIPMEVADKLASRVVHIEPTPCAPVNAALASQIILATSHLQITGGHLTTNIIVSNNSNSVFDASSTGGAPIRLSWRFVPISHEGEALSEPGWEHRQDLALSISPGDSKQARISTDLPEKPGSYIFEVSLVLDGVAWLHDLGMNVSKTPVSVNND